MSILYHPRPGTLLLCDFDSGFRPPEIVKKRPVVVISRTHTDLVSVVPISTTTPNRIEAWHHQLEERSIPRFLDRWWVPHWAKCDIIMTVAFHRLDRFRTGQHPSTGKRLYATHVVTAEDLASIRLAVARVLGIS
ncbi:MAG: type II toxin-antitoxin system PemK/MazF family toxin [Planctomycetaceae bacterium]|nr:type II toxin-antitoxin system PemK/MazF family toxin [Planctomycetaceae bacterium]